MNTSISPSTSLNNRAEQMVRLQQVLTVTLADWKSPLPIRQKQADQSSLLAPRRCSLLSRNPMVVKPRFSL